LASLAPELSTTISLLPTLIIYLLYISRETQINFKDTRENSVLNIKAINFLETKDQGLNEAVNIGTGKGTSVLEVIQKFEKISNQKLNWQFGERRSGDVIEIFANAKKSFEKLNWKAELTVDDAIKDAWNWELALKKLNL
jgi:UDP-glucose 4-epimerase